MTFPYDLGSNQGSQIEDLEKTASKRNLSENAWLYD